MKSKSKFFLWVGSRNGDQQGFTLIELLVGLVIIGIVVSGIAMTILQIINNSARSNNHNTAVRQVQNAGTWLSQDIQMAENITAEMDDNGFPLHLKWYGDWPFINLHQVEYKIEGDKLIRTYSDNSTADTDTITARYIDPEQTSCSLGGSDKYGQFVLCNIVVKVGTGQQMATATRVYEIMQRPKATY